jgi:hypothetical protein
MASSAEREIRDALVSWWHSHEPRGRVVHELPLSSFSGEGRADLAVVFPDMLVLVEIKSERDKLTRLQDQFKAMQASSHDFMCVLHDRWFDPSGEVQDQTWINWAAKDHIWRYPEPAKGWTFERYSRGYTTSLPPNPYRLLSLLWADELRDCYGYAGIMGIGRATMPAMVSDLGQKLNGRQITRAVCAALRRRKFNEADPAMDDSPTPQIEF